MIHDGDEVAILPAQSSLPSQVCEIATVRHAGPVFIELEDGRMFATLGGNGLNTRGYMLPAREEHRAALRKVKRHEEALQ